MWLLHVLAAHLQWYGFLDVGLSMIDGSYYRNAHDDNFDFGGDPDVGFGGGD